MSDTDYGSADSLEQRQPAVPRKRTNPDFDASIFESALRASGDPVNVPLANTRAGTTTRVDDSTYVHTPAVQPHVLRRLVDVAPVLTRMPEAAVHMVEIYKGREEELYEAAADTEAFIDIYRRVQLFTGGPIDQQQMAWDTMTGQMQRAFRGMGYVPPEDRIESGGLVDLPSIPLVSDVAGKAWDVTLGGAIHVGKKAGMAALDAFDYASTFATDAYEAAYLMDEQGMSLTPAGMARSWRLARDAKTSFDASTLQEVSERFDADSMALIQRLAAGEDIYKIANDYGKYGDAEHGAALEALMDFAADPMVVDALSDLNDARITPGDDLMNLLGKHHGDEGFTLGREIVNFGYLWFTDPTLIAGKGYRSWRLARNGLAVRVAAGADNTATANVVRSSYTKNLQQHVDTHRAAAGVTGDIMDKGYWRGLAAIPGISRHDRVAVMIADAARSKKEGWKRLMDSRGALSGLIQPLQDAGVKTADDVVDFFASEVGLKTLLDGRFTHIMGEYTELPKLNRLGLVKARSKLAFGDSIDFMGSATMPFREAIKADELATQVGGVLNALQLDHVARGFDKVTNLLPKNDWIAYNGRDTVQTLDRLLNFGVRGKQRRELFDAFIRAETQPAKEAVFQNIMRTLLANVGAYDNPEAVAYFEKFIAKGGQKFAPGEIDSIRDIDMLDDLENAREFPSGIFSGHQADAFQIPPLRELSAYFRRERAVKFLTGVPNSRMADAIMNIWRPAVILRPAFSVRAWLEESLSQFARHGPRAMMQRWLVVPLGGKDADVPLWMVERLKSGFLTAFTQPALDMRWGTSWHGRAAMEFAHRGRGLVFGKVESVLETPTAMLRGFARKRADPWHIRAYRDVALPVQARRRAIAARVQELGRPLTAREMQEYTENTGVAQSLKEVAGAEVAGIPGGMIDRQSFYTLEMGTPDNPIDLHLVHVDNEYGLDSGGPLHGPRFANTAAMTAAFAESTPMLYARSVYLDPTRAQRVAATLPKRFVDGTDQEQIVWLQDQLSRFSPKLRGMVTGPDGLLVHWQDTDARTIRIEALIEALPAERTKMREFFESLRTPVWRADDIAALFTDPRAAFNELADVMGAPRQLKPGEVFHHDVPVFYKGEESAPAVLHPDAIEHGNIQHLEGPGHYNNFAPPYGLGYTAHPTAGGHQVTQYGWVADRPMKKLHVDEPLPQTERDMGQRLAEAALQRERLETWAYDKLDSLDPALNATADDALGTLNDIDADRLAQVQEIIGELGLTEQAVDLDEYFQHLDQALGLARNADWIDDLDLSTSYIGTMPADGPEQMRWMMQNLWGRYEGKQYNLWLRDTQGYDAIANDVTSMGDNWLPSSETIVLLSLKNVVQMDLPIERISSLNAREVLTFTKTPYGFADNAPSVLRHKDIIHGLFDGQPGWYSGDLSRGIPFTVDRSYFAPANDFHRTNDIALIREEAQRERSVRAAQARANGDEIKARMHEDTGEHLDRYAGMMERFGFTEVPKFVHTDDASQLLDEIAQFREWHASGLAPSALPPLPTLKSYLAMWRDEVLDVPVGAYDPRPLHDMMPGKLDEVFDALPDIESRFLPLPTREVRMPDEVGDARWHELFKKSRLGDRDAANELQEMVFVAKGTNDKEVNRRLMNLRRNVSAVPDATAMTQAEKDALTEARRFFDTIDATTTQDELAAALSELEGLAGRYLPDVNVDDLDVDTLLDELDDVSRTRTQSQALGENAPVARRALDALFTSPDGDDLHEMILPLLEGNFTYGRHVVGRENRLPTNVVGPKLAAAPKVGKWDKFKNWSFEIMGRQIAAVARQPLAIHNYAIGLREADRLLGSMMRDPRLRGMAAAIVPDVDRLQDALWEGTQRLGRDAEALNVAQVEAIARRLFPDMANTSPGEATFVIDNDLGTSMASTNTKTRTVRLNETAMNANYRRGLAYERGRMVDDTGEVLAGSKQKQLVFEQQGVDLTDLQQWFDEHDGAASYMAFVEEHERAHLVLGHTGTHMDDWMNGESIAKEIAANNYAFTKLEMPFGQHVDLATLGGSTEGKALYSWWQNERRVRLELSRVAMNRMVADTAPFIDDPGIRSQFADNARNIFPFWFAQEQFYKRWVRTFVQSPEAIQRLNLAHHGLYATGFIQENDKGEQVFVYPGSQWVTSTLAHVFDLFSSSSFSLPLEVPLTGEIKFAAPGLDSATGTARDLLPQGSPFVATSLRFLQVLDPDAFAGTEEHVLGERGANRPFLEMWVPSTLTRVWKVITSDPEMMAATMNGAIAMLDAAQSDLVPGYSDKNPETPHNKEVFLDRVYNWSRTLGVAKMLVGAFGPAAPTPEVDPDDLNPEFLYLIRSGMPYEHAVERFLSAHPNGTAHMLFDSTTPSKAPVDPTEATYNFMSENQDLFFDKERAGPWLTPAGKGDYFGPAWERLLAWKVRERRGADEFYDELKYRSAAAIYYPWQDEKDAQLATARARNDSVAVKRIEDTWRTWKTQFLASHPVFDDRYSSKKTQDLRSDVRTQLRDVFEQRPSLPPEIDHAPEMRQMVDYWWDMEQGIADVRAAPWSETRKKNRIIQIQQNYANWARPLARTHPTLRAFYERILVPDLDKLEDSQKLDDAEEVEL